MSSVVTETASRYTEDGFGLPDTWEDRMRAGVHGHMPWEDFEDLARQCAAVADRASPDPDGLFDVVRRLTGAVTPACTGGRSRQRSSRGLDSHGAGGRRNRERGRWRAMDNQR